MSARWRDLGLDTDFGGTSDPEFVAELPFQGTECLVLTVPNHPTGLCHEDTRRTLMQLVLEPFQQAADRAVELLCGATEEQRTEFPEIAAEGREVG